ncbi:MAG TPA: nitroreductase/quinone reductase family protein, partial [Anaerolineaceae bacterium]
SGESMNGNSIVAGLLRSPLHGVMSASTLVITVTGRKTGRKISTPVNYIQEGQTLWILSSRERTWWRNIRGGTKVSLRLRGREVAGTAEALLDPQVVCTHLAEYVRRMPASAGPLGIRMAGGEPDPGDVARAAASRLMVRVQVGG